MPPLCTPVALTISFPTGGRPRRARPFSWLATGRKMSVECFGDLDVVYYSERRRPERVTIKNMAVVTGLQFDLFSLNVVQENYGIYMNKTGTYTLCDQVHFTKFPTGN